MASKKCVGVVQKGRTKANMCCAFLPGTFLKCTLFGGYDDDSGNGDDELP